MIIVPKSWGEEHIIVNDEYCGKLLMLREGKQCSYHYHKVKKETFYPLWGKVLLTVEGEEFELKEAYTLEPYAKHRFMGLTNATILEISTHHDDADTVRL